MPRRFSAPPRHWFARPRSRSSRETRRCGSSGGLGTRSQHRRGPDRHRHARAARSLSDGVGSTAEEVIRGAACPVLAVTQACENLPDARPLSHALVAVDGSPASHAAVTFAAELARVEGCRLTLCNVVEPPSVRWDDLDRSTFLEKELEDYGHAELDAECARAAAFGAPVDSVIRIGDAISGILAEAQKVAADCIVLGTHGRAGIPRFVIGSTAEGVLRSSPLPVCTIRSR